MRGRGGGNNGGGGGGGGGGGRKGPNPLNRTYESTGPDVKIRGTALHIAEKYVSLARDAQSSGDPVLAENYLQHAEHYYRIIAAAQASMPQAMPIVRSDIQVDEDEEDFDDTAAEPVRVEPRGEARGPVGEDGFMPVDTPQPFLDDLPAIDARANERARDDRPRGERPERGSRFRSNRGERPERADQPRDGNRYEGRQRPPRGERPARGEARTDAGERSEGEGDLSALPAFLTAAPSRTVSAPAPTPAPVAVAAPEEVPVEVAVDEPVAEEAPKRRTRGGRGRGRRPEYEAGATPGEGEGEAAPAAASVEERRRGRRLSRHSK